MLEKEFVTKNGKISVRKGHIDSNIFPRWMSPYQTNTIIKFMQLNTCMLKCLKKQCFMFITFDNLYFFSIQLFFSYHIFIISFQENRAYIILRSLQKTTNYFFRNVYQDVFCDKMWHFRTFWDLLKFFMWNGIHEISPTHK